MTSVDIAYAEWLKTWADVDFAKLSFLPKIKDKAQLLAMAKVRNLVADRRKRTMHIYKGKSLKAVDKNPQEIDAYDENESITSYE